LSFNLLINRQKYQYSTHYNDISPFAGLFPFAMVMFNQCYLGENLTWFVKTKFARFNKPRGANKVRRGGARSPKSINVPVHILDYLEYNRLLTTKIFFLITLYIFHEQLYVYLQLIKSSTYNHVFRNVCISKYVDSSVTIFFLYMHW